MMKQKDFEILFTDFTRSRERAYINRFKRALDQQVKDYFADKPVSQETIYKAVRSLYFNAASKYARRMRIKFRSEKKAISGQMGSDPEFAEAFKKFFDIALRNLAQRITETTLKQIEKFIAQQVAEGFSLPELGDKIKELLEINKTRAMRIARTETTGAANAAGFFSALNADYYMTKEWLAIDDGRTRLTHGHAGVNGTKIPLEEPFQVGMYQMMYPGDKGGDGRLPVGPEEVVNCRCTLAYRARRDEAGRIMLKD